MPSVSAAQHRAMEAAAHGHSTLGIPEAVGKEFVAADSQDTTIHAAGVMFVCKGAALFLKRSNEGDHAGEWCFPGGKLEGDETPEEAAVRECKEEIGKFPKGDRKLHTVTRMRTPPAIVNSVPVPGADTGAATIETVPLDAAPVTTVIFSTFIQVVEEEFIPTLDHEHVGYAWAPLLDPPQPLHPGVQISINKFGWHELDIARAMVRGELTSPQYYENVALFLIRITGTGFSYRGGLKEHVYRYPDEYLTQDFIDRCQGLPVIMQHPESKTLNTEEFRERSLGSVVVPFITNNEPQLGLPMDEVWGVGKIYDMEAAKLMAEEKLSTSPGVVFRNRNGMGRITFEDGAKLSVEDAPTLLDHIAVCPNGVWDKGQQPNGIVSETATGDSTMPTKTDAAKADGEKDMKDDAAQADASKVDGEPDKLLSKLDSVMDAVRGVADACSNLSKRMDSMEEDRKADKARADAAKKDEDKEEKDDTSKKDAAKKDGDDKDEDGAKKTAADSKKDGEDEDKEDAAKVDNADIRSQIADMSARFDKMEASSRGRSDAEADAMADIQSRADSVFQSLGMKAPRPMDGEQQMPYRRRLLKMLQPHSEAWKGVDLTVMSADSAAFTNVETHIFNDAQAAAKDPGKIGAGKLVESVSFDGAGRKIRTFHGDPNVWLDGFRCRPRMVTKFNNQAGRL